MTNITLTIHTATESTESIRFNARDAQPVRVQAQHHVNYELIDEATGFAPEPIDIKRVGNDLHITFEDSGASDSESDLVIEGYYDEEGTNLLIGLHENGNIYTYVPVSGEVDHAFSQLAEEIIAPHVLGGEALKAAAWAFHPGWLLALVPVAVLIASGGSSGKSGTTIDINKPEEPADTTAPAAPTIVISTDENNDGWLSGSELSEATRVAVTIRVPDDVVAGDTVTVTDGTTPQNIVLTQEQIDAGYVETTVARPEEGETLTVTATITDKAGNTSTESSDSAVVDTTPPTITINPDITGDDVINAAEAQEGLVISGTTDAEEGQIVTVWIDGNRYDSDPVTEHDTETGLAIWSITVPADKAEALSQGELNVSAQVRDKAGNFGEAGHKVLVDTVSPEITQSSVGDGNLSAVEAAATVLSGEVKGVEAGQMVTLTVTDKDGKSVSFEAPIEDGGSYSITENLSVLADGEITVVATVTDNAGNQATDSKTAILDITPPSITITAVANEDNVVQWAEKTATGFKVTGTIDGVDGVDGVEAGQSVTVTFLDHEGVEISIPVIVSEDGASWAAPVTAEQTARLKDGTVSATVSDLAGNKATISEGFTVDAPPAPTITGYHDSVDYVQGVEKFTGESNASITASGQILSKFGAVLSGFTRLTELEGEYGSFTFNTETGEWTYTFKEGQGEATGDNNVPLNELLTVTDAEGTEYEVQVSIQNTSSGTDVIATTVALKPEAETIDDSQIHGWLAGTSEESGVVVSDIMVDGSQIVGGSYEVLNQGKLTIFENGSYIFEPYDDNITLNINYTIDGVETQTKVVSGSNTVKYSNDLLGQITGEVNAPDGQVTLRLYVNKESTDDSGPGFLGYPNGADVVVKVVDGKWEISSDQLRSVLQKIWHTDHLRGDDEIYLQVKQVDPVTGKVSEVSSKYTFVADIYAPQATNVEYVAPEEGREFGSVTALVSGDLANEVESHADTDNEVIVTYEGKEIGKGTVGGLADGYGQHLQIDVILTEALPAGYDPDKLKVHVIDKAGNIGTSDKNTLEPHPIAMPTPEIEAYVDSMPGGKDGDIKHGELTNDKRGEIRGTIDLSAEGGNTVDEIRVTVRGLGPIRIEVPEDAVGVWTWTVTKEQLADLNTTGSLADGDVEVIARAYNKASNGVGPASDSFQFFVDGTAPEVKITFAEEETLLAGEDTLVTIKFNEEVTGFTIDDLRVEGGEVSQLQDTEDPTKWTVIFTPEPDYEGQASVTIDAGSYTDIAGNKGMGDSSHVVVDTRVPTVTVHIDKDSLIVGESATLTLTFSEVPHDVNGNPLREVNSLLNLNATDGVTVTTLSRSVDGLTWTGTITPRADVEANTTITVANDFFNEAGNRGSTNSDTVLVDTTPPTITINPDITGDDVINAAEAQEGLVISGTTDAEEGQIVTVWIDGNRYDSDPVTEHDTETGLAIWSITVPADKAEALSQGELNVSAQVRDKAGNFGEAGHKVLVDTVSPEITQSSVGDGNLSAVEAAATVLSGEVKGVEAGQMVTLTVTDKDGKSVSFEAPIEDGGSYSITENLSVLADGEITVVATVTDNAGNQATDSKTAILDITPPSITITAVANEDNVVQWAEKTATGFKVTGTIDGVDGVDGVEAGQSVTVTFLDHEGVEISIPVIVSEDGASWAAPVTAEQTARLKDGTVSATVSDLAGNKATISEGFTVDAPPAPTITGYHDSVDYVQGVEKFTGESNASITASGQILSKFGAVLSGFTRLTELEGEYGSFTFNTETGEWTYTFKEGQGEATGDNNVPLNELLTVTDAEGTEYEVQVSIQNTSSGTDVIATTVALKPEAETIDDSQIHGWLAGTSEESGVVVSDIMVDGSQIVGGSYEVLNQGKLTIFENGSYIFEPYDDNITLNINYTIDGVETQTKVVSGSNTVKYSNDLLGQITGEVNAPDGQVTLRLYVNKESTDDSGPGFLGYPNGADVVVKVVDGKWEISSDQLRSVLQKIWHTDHLRGDDEIYLQVKQVDPVTGKVSEVSSKYTFVADIYAPQATNVEYVAPEEGREFGSVTALVSGDLANEVESHADTDNEVIVTYEGKEIGKGTVGGLADGYGQHLQIDVILTEALPAGYDPDKLKVHVIDKAGNIGTSDKNTLEPHPIAMPTPEIEAYVDSMPGGKDGDIKHGELTNDKRGEIRGTIDLSAEGGNTVDEIRVTVRGLGPIRIEVPEDAVGVWTWTVTKEQLADLNTTGSLADGDVEVIARAYNKASNGVGPASDSFQFFVDGTAPEVKITFAEEETLLAGEDTLVTIKFNEEVTGFTIDDLRVEGGEVSQLQDTEDPTKWTVIFTPEPDYEGQASVTIDAGSYTDIAGNKGMGDSSHVVVDTRVPTVTVHIDKDSLIVGESATLTLTFSEVPHDVNGNPLTQVNSLLNLNATDDVIVTPLSRSEDGLTWTGTITPIPDIEANITITVANDFFDKAGNRGSTNSDTVTVVVDTTPPTNTINPDLPGADVINAADAKED